MTDQYTDPAAAPSASDRLLGTGRPPAASIRREFPEPEPARRALVEKLMAEIKLDEKHHEPAFRRMRQDMDFVFGIQYEGQTDDDDRYLVNVAQKHVERRVAAVYARNPRVYAKRRQRLEFRLWDEKPETLMQAQQDFALWEAARMEAGQTGQVFPVPPPAEAMALLKEVSDVRARHLLFDRIARTLELLHRHEQAELLPDYKEQMKQLVRRVCTTGVGWVRQGYQRLMEPRPDVASAIEDHSQRLLRIEAMTADLDDGVVHEHQAEAEELRGMIEALRNEPQILVREGITWDFPLSTAVIPDRATRQLKGLVGSRWVTEKFLMTPEKVKEQYSVDLSSGGYSRYRADYQPTASQWVASPTGDRDDMVCVYMMHHKLDGKVYVMAEGYPDFLIEPDKPEVEVEGFWVHKALTFNDVEHERQIYPKSDVRQIRHPQRELNRTGEARRQHRIANRPLYLAAPGMFEEEEKKSLAFADAHDVVEVASFQPGADVGNYMKPLPKVPIDPNVYETQTIKDDMLLAGGAQEANLGPVSGGSATEASIAEGSRISTVASNIDDLDGFLSRIARGDAQIMLANYSAETVTRIVGPGAVWPELSSRDIVDEITLEIEAGSSGRPNKAQELANFKEVAPFLLQIPGITPQWMAKHLLRTLDDRIEITEAFLDGLPSITSLNRMAQVGTGDPATDPAQQGGEGGDNQARDDRPPERDGAAFPAAGGPQAEGQTAGRQ